MLATVHISRSGINLRASRICWGKVQPLLGGQLAMSSGEQSNNVHPDLERVERQLAVGEHQTYREQLALYKELLAKEVPGPYRKVYMKLVSDPTVGTRTSSINLQHKLRASWSPIPREEEEEFVDEWEDLVPSSAHALYAIFHYYDNYSDGPKYAFTHADSAQRMFQLLADEQRESDHRKHFDAWVMEDRGDMRMSTLYDIDEYGRYEYPDKGDRYVMVKVNIEAAQSDESSKNE